MELLASKIGENKSIFLKDVVTILSIQIIFQVLLTLLFHFFPPYFEVTPVQYLNYGSYFLIFLISTVTLKYTIANKILVYLFVIEFFYLSISSILVIYLTTFYYLQYVFAVSFPLLVTLYLFFYSINPNTKGQFKLLIQSIITISIIITIVNSNLDSIVDLSSLNYDDYKKTVNSVYLNSYYVNLICLSFLMFVWYTYYQGHYLLSEFLPAILSLQTLMIINEVYQLYNYNHLIKHYIDAQYFNALINIGFIIIWLVRLKYLTNPESKKNEYFVLNYDMLSGYVEKPHNQLWDSILIKLGKQKIVFGSLLLFAITCIPLVLISDFNFFPRFNIIVMLFFLLGVMIYAIIYTQRKWFNHIGFLIKERKN
jgi:hypothetical protein